MRKTVELGSLLPFAAMHSDDSNADKVAGARRFDLAQSAPTGCQLD